MDLKHLARLAKFKLSDQELEMFARQTQEFLAYIEQLSTVDTAKIEPLVQPFDILQLDEDNDFPKIPSPVQNGPYKVVKFL